MISTISSGLLPTFNAACIWSDNSGCECPNAVIAAIVHNSLVFKSTAFLVYISEYGNSTTNSPLISFFYYCYYFIT